MGYEDAAWETKPTDANSVGAGNEAIQDVKTGVRSALANEHVVTLGAAVNLQATHRAGSAVAYVGTSAPTLTPGGVALSYIDEGRLWVNTTGASEGPPVVYGELYVYKWISGPVGAGGTYGWRPVDVDMIVIAGLAAIPSAPAKAAKVAITAYHIPTSAPDALAGAIWIA
jgi:hypothetical protein